MLTYKDSLRQRLYSDSFEEGLRFGIKYFATVVSGGQIDKYIDVISKESGLAKSDIVNALKQASGNRKGQAGLTDIKNVFGNLEAYGLKSDAAKKAAEWVGKNSGADFAKHIGAKTAEEYGDEVRKDLAAGKKVFDPSTKTNRNNFFIKDVTDPTTGAVTQESAFGSKYRALQQGRSTRADLIKEATTAGISPEVFGKWNNDQWTAFEKDLAGQTHDLLHGKRDWVNSYNNYGNSNSNTGKKAEKGLGNWIKKNPWKAGGIALGAGALGYGLYKASQPSDRDRYYR
jgi:hypothetical protein